MSFPFLLKHEVIITALGVLALCVHTFGWERVVAALVAYVLIVLLARGAGRVSVPGGTNPPRR